MSLFFLWPFLFQQDLVNSSLIAVPLSSVVVNWPEVFCSSHSEPHGRWLLSLAFCGQDISALAWNNILPTTSHFLKKDIVSYSSVAWFFFSLRNEAFLDTECSQNVIAVFTFFILTGDGHCSLQESPWEVGVMAICLGKWVITFRYMVPDLPWEIQTVVKTYYRP